MSVGTRGSINMNWLQEAAIQARNGIPVPLAFLGEHIGVFHLDDFIKVLGAGYLVLQIGYLVWKWRKEARNGFKNNK